MDKSPPDPTENHVLVETFSMRETAERLELLLAEGDWLIKPTEHGYRLESEDDTLIFQAPLLQPVRGTESTSSFLTRLHGAEPLQLLVLVQAGASAMGLWSGSELVAHKALKKYVVRGRGRAQPTHLKTKGKSRYGSRLRLRNASAQLSQTNEKLSEWHGEHGPADDVFMSCPKTTWPALFASTPPPPFTREQVIRIPLDVRVPDFGELRNVHRKMSRGRLLRVAQPPESS
jgi:hypothetical protein